MAQSSSSLQIPAWVNRLQQYQTLVVPIAMIAMLSAIVLPMPTMLMDVMLAANLALAAMILLTTIFVEKPLDFSVFPSLLLGTTLFRLVLNIATTRLILSADAQSPDQAVAVAGEVIETFSEIVTSGSLVVGLILFIILIIVQFVVITKGSTRISEVAARFTLDGMPGKQMAIDADLNAGLIDEHQAKARREEIANEADFYGAMDGAAKFVRGDAIAGIIITCINILGGITVGMLQKDWGFVETIGVFTRLTIGDGLVSQMPAFVISLAAGLIVTRSSSKMDLGAALAQQLGRRQSALWITAGFLAVLALLGLPAIPLLLLAGGLAGTAWMMRNKVHRKAADDAAQARAEQTRKPEPEPVEKSMGVDTLELEVGYAMVQLVDQSQGGDLLERITMIRRQLATEQGLVMPPVRIRDNIHLGPNDYHIKIRGNSVAQGQIYPNQFLAMDGGLASEPLPGTPTREPAFGLDAVWIQAGQKQRAEGLNYTVVDPASVLATHLTEVVKNHAHELLTREETGNLITQLREKAPKLTDEVLGPAAGAAGGGDAPMVKPGELQKVLQNLLRERVPIRDLETIVETLGDWAGRTKDLDVLTEYVRNALRRTVCSQYTVTEPVPGSDSGNFDGQAPDTPKLYCVSLDPAIEDQINGYIERSEQGTSMTMPPAVANRITTAMLEEINRLVHAGHHPVVLASPQVRAQVRRLLEPHLQSAAVLGYNEVSKGVEVESLGLVQLSQPKTSAQNGSASGNGRAQSPDASSLQGAMS